MLTPGLFVWGDFVEPPADALEFEALGKQWHWSYRFPGEDGEFGNTDIRRMSPENPMGLDPDDPAGMDDIRAIDHGRRQMPDEPWAALLRWNWRPSTRMS